MLTGQVDDQLRAPLRIPLRTAPNAPPQEIVAWVDTAFNGGLTIPRTLIPVLGLPQEGTVEAVMLAPRHPYARGLLASTQHARRRGALLEAIRGSPPDLAALPPGCAFAPRCDHATTACLAEMPPLAPVADGRLLRCVLGGDVVSR